MPIQSSFASFSTISTINIGDIDIHNTNFQITTRTDIDWLSKSISDVGLIAPPVVLCVSDKSYLIVSGFRRVAACKRLGWPHIEALVLNSAIETLLCSKVAIADNLCQRELNIVEQSRAMALLFRECSTIDGVQKLATQLGLPDNRSYIRKIKNICRFSLTIQKGIIDQSIALPIALELNKCAPKEADALAQIFSTLKTSLNKQRDILVLLQEIAHREDSTVLQILGDEPITHVLENSKIDRNRKMTLLRTYLKRRRFPTLSYAEERRRQKVKTLKLDKNSVLVCPKNFEGTLFSLTLKFQNLDEFGKRLAEAEDLYNNPFFEEIVTIDELE